MVGDAGTVEDAVALIREQHPDVVLLDVHMPDGGGVEVIARVGEDCPCLASWRCRCRTRPRT